jgi:hypothetical protein
MKIRKIFLILFILILVFVIFQPKVYALGDIISSGDTFLEKGEDKVDKTALKTTSDIMYNMFLSIGVATAVIMAAVLGIKFMTSSIEGKAKVKEQLTIFIVGCVVVFGAFTIWSISINIGNSLKGSSNFGGFRRRGF